MKFNLIPVSSSRLENNFKWRLLKVVYFILGVISGLIYSLINSWYYTNCPLNDLPWSENKLLCTEFFAWEELIWSIVIFLVLFRLLFPLIERLTLYIVSEKK